MGEGKFGPNLTPEEMQAIRETPINTKEAVPGLREKTKAMSEQAQQQKAAEAQQAEQARASTAERGIPDKTGPAFETIAPSDPMAKELGEQVAALKENEAKALAAAKKAIARAPAPRGRISQSGDTPPPNRADGESAETVQIEPVKKAGFWGKLFGRK
ncbi:MAG: hypothetical protein COU35_05290 [Candidatus Magasanikbacteria bacterium CG10_big_fil_rev_8_21_14_0_10_47_10]|uniref:Uncharacterized protein n=1 Tax=Candidatus Magasanikbacteria bacterium CG10_big_fil_rev_8_21_14_0_10_47_10 TaxID=1974652 RepID=A0A2H0TR64_9BACT|nr:MAG: hypothetical protein COU35_05290 [Candidatus Magasanikbacteria bacterium CG10_big_fil_rev_8_21_14_0_10_47_10]